MTDRQKRIQEIRDRMEWMNENLSGCDWCCGGGDEEMTNLRTELDQLETEEYGIKLCQCGNRPSMFVIKNPSGQNWRIQCRECWSSVEVSSKTGAIQDWNNHDRQK